MVLVDLPDLMVFLALLICLNTFALTAWSLVYLDSSEEIVVIIWVSTIVIVVMIEMTWRVITVEAFPDLMMLGLVVEVILVISG